MRYQSQLPSPPGRFSRTAARHAHTSVDLKLRTPHQLFDERDPSPFRERDLDDDAAKYIHGSFRDLRDHRRAKLSIYFETLGEFRDRPQIIVDAIHSFFSFEADSKRRELREIFRQGVIALFIGIGFLFSCTSIGRSMKVDESGWQLAAMLKEGLAIMGWVAMWRPISIFLYEWWPIRDALTTHVKLSRIAIDIRSAGHEVDLHEPSQSGVKVLPLVARPRGRAASPAETLRGH